jgi:hypothetical protein
MIGVIYKWQPYNKINGSVFYAFEYYSMLFKYSNTTLFFVNSKPWTKKDKKLIKHILLEKYSISDDILNNINFITLIDCYKTTKHLHKSFFVDVHSYNSIYQMLPGIEKLLYCDNARTMQSYIPYPEKTYGYYDYQYISKREYRIPLKLNFDIFKNFDNDNNNSNNIDKWFVSSIESKEDDLKDYLPNDYVFKIHSTFINIFEQFNNFLYIQNGGLDTNNRLIPEAFFYKKNLKIVKTKNWITDSILLRYEDILKDGLQKYWLTKDDPLIMELLKKEM